MMRISGKSYDSLAVERPVPFPLPLARHARTRKGFEYWWRLLNYTFELPSPFDFPAFPEVGIDEALDRYCTAAIDLASSECLAYDSHVSVQLERRDGDTYEERISFDFPSKELVRGFLALFRQFYSKDELASFAKVRDKLVVKAKSQTDDDAARRLDELKAWGAAHGRLLGYSLKQLAGERLIDDGRVAGPIPDEGKPTQLISAFAYGDHLHWGSSRGVVTRWEADQFLGPTMRLQLLGACGGLAYFYMGFAVIVGRTIGRDGEVSP